MKGDWTGRRFGCRCRSAASPDFTAIVRSTTVDEINAAFKAAASRAAQAHPVYSDEYLVSSDIVAPRRRARSTPR